MKPARLAFFVITGALCGLAASAQASDTNPFANAQVETIIRAPNGAVTECSESAQPGQGRTEKLARRSASLRLDPCEWSAAVDPRDPDGPAMLYRNGVDVVCSFEGSWQPGAAMVKRESYATRLSSQGTAAVTVDKDEEAVIAGKTFRHQVLSGTPAGQMARTLPRQRFHVWFWSAGTRWMELACYGPVAVVDGDLPAIRALAQSLRIGVPAADAPARKP
ncbi:hypothetical protein ACFJIW_04395 [Tahibacter sp. UC22_41]|uniref:hypothetical protein n=1 Tax=Tahibacter sp. UC22_41 TaxID=3350178 RepID=UPI0036D77200